MSNPGAGVPGGLTYRDYAALPDDGTRYQLVEGELVMTPSPTRWHQRVVLQLAADLQSFVNAAALGEVAVAPLDVILRDDTVLQPDILFISRARSSIARDANIVGAPDLCVEVVSRGSVRLDRTRKREIYARHGVMHYWIVDLSARSIEEFVLEGVTYRLRSMAGNDEPFRPAALPGFEFRLSSAGLPAGL